QRSCKSVGCWSESAWAHQRGAQPVRGTGEHRAPEAKLRGRSAPFIYLNSTCRRFLSALFSLGGAERLSASSARHIPKHVPIAAVRSGKSARLWTRTAADATAAARANGPASAVRQARHTL